MTRPRLARKTVGTGLPDWPSFWQRPACKACPDGHARQHQAWPDPRLQCIISSWYESVSARESHFWIAGLTVHVCMRAWGVGGGGGGGNLAGLQGRSDLQLRLLHALSCLAGLAVERDSIRQRRWWSAGIRQAVCLRHTRAEAPGCSCALLLSPLTCIDTMSRH